MKRVLSFILTLLLLLPTLYCVAAASEKEYPYIYMSGFGNCDLYKNYGTGSAEVLYPPAADKMKDAVMASTGPLIRYSYFRDADRLAEELLPAAKSLAGDLEMNPDGTSRPGVGAGWVYPAVTPSQDKYTFHFDYRLDMRESAASLDRFIDYVMSGTGASKVVLNGHSMACNVIATYMTVYKEKALNVIDAIVFDSPAFLGLVSVGEAISGRFDLDSMSLIRYLGTMLDGNEFEGLIDSALLIFRKSGILDGVLGTVEKLYDDAGRALLAQTLMQVVMYSPGFWSLVRAEEYESAKAYVFGDTVSQYSELIERTDFYIYQVNRKIVDNIKEFMSAGIKVGIISRYNLQDVPIHEDMDYQSDNTIETVCTSLGVTAAPIGETLGVSYHQEVNDGHNHLSADGILDASTCEFPEITWFVRDLAHSAGSDGIRSLSRSILYSDAQLTVFDDASYPQFMRADKDTGELLPVSEKFDDTRTPYTWFGLLARFFTELVSFIIAGI